MSLDPILAECELEPSIAEIVSAERAAISSLEKLRRGPVLIDSGNSRSIWLRTAVEPPLDLDIELLLGRRWGVEVVYLGWASRRFLNGALTFWVWHNGRSRLVRPKGWRASA
ncbi:hypothetical protein Hden_1185 [Hyphomicrobium denitrificans ATCC 51888]|uniref:Uncharacterized protein n=1 Tax=Hyphomicrobium denitrificans (strain ATCC 51888 / DSM 1869 / NCIMB 11706 / TK 0415) TaxID=582899 RepID=D8JVV9_HYPDA|nr:hypothetical protein [Hyphomicrobium denitrificans]ADJ22998.1 hypothetical protein Hden_1185 [Hyphomicrobium denitrificans ATCC 51888]